MSRRKRREGSTPQPAPPARPAPRSDAGPSLLVQVGILAAVVAVVTLVAELAAANLGVSLSIGTIAFAIVLMYFILQR
jgi:uncharacterized membrane protein